MYIDGFPIISPELIGHTVASLALSGSHSQALTYESVLTSEIDKRNRPAVWGYTFLLYSAAQKGKNILINMNISMYVCMNIYRYTGIHIQRYIYIYAYIYMHTYIFICICIHTLTHTYIQTYIHIDTHIYSYAYTNIHTCIH
jgi:hypothetical protein